MPRFCKPLIKADADFIVKANTMSSLNFFYLKNAKISYFEVFFKEMLGGWGLFKKFSCSIYALTSKRKKQNGFTTSVALLIFINGDTISMSDFKASEEKRENLVQETFEQIREMIERKIQLTVQKDNICQLKM